MDGLRQLGVVEGLLFEHGAEQVFGLYDDVFEGLFLRRYCLNYPLYLHAVVRNVVVELLAPRVVVEQVDLDGVNIQHFPDIFPQTELGVVRLQPFVYVAV